MEKTLQLLLFVGCLVVIQVQGYTLRDPAFRRFPLEDFIRNNRLREVSDELKSDCEDHKLADCFMIPSFNEMTYTDYCDDHKPFVEKYCRRTCNVDNCASESGSPKPPHPPGEIESCSDSVNDCAKLIEETKICSDPYYRGWVKHYCRQSCNMC